MRLSNEICIPVDSRRSKHIYIVKKLQPIKFVRNEYILLSMIHVIRTFHIILIRMYFVANISYCQHYI